MGRRLNTKLPSTRTRTSLPNLPSLLEKEGKYREQQRSGYNKRHSAKQASELQPGDYVFIKDLKRQGSVLTRHQNPRSYIICTDQGTIRRNRSHLVATPASSSSPALVSTQVREQSSPGHHVSTPRTPHSPRPSPTAVSEGNSETQPRVSRSGRPINPPKRHTIYSIHETRFKSPRTHELYEMMAYIWIVAGLAYLALAKVYVADILMAKANAVERGTFKRLAAYFKGGLPKDTGDNSEDSTASTTTSPGGNRCTMSQTMPSPAEEDGETGEPRSLQEVT
ncbi:Pol polyprotein [Plakobranchus ocellatus]|uniref:Pol polyprotein n=1 Tax=Plakobranchus ocellatus TaxID=259542 RepID=A0AAV4C2Z3_9GAST|nr:Pol polyprotein [Plakobranchus ocellatus]